MTTPASMPKYDVDKLDHAGALAALREARADAAAARVELRDAEARLRGSVPAEQVAERVAELRAAGRRETRALLVERALRRADLAELIGVVQLDGDSAEQLDAAAASLARVLQ